MRYLAAGIALWLCAATASAASVEYGPKYYRPTEEFVTPHVRWAKPDARGPVKALFIVWRAGMREIVELSQRMELQYEVLAVADNKTFCETKKSYNPSFRDPETMTADTEKKLAGEYDVIVLGNVNWSSLPLIIRYYILKKVKDGTGLLALTNGEDEYWKRAMAKQTPLAEIGAVPFAGLPAFAKYKDASAFYQGTTVCANFGQGRIVQLRGFSPPRFQALTPGPTGNLLDTKFIEYDYYLAYLIHLLDAAAGREQTVRVLDPGALRLGRGDFKAIEFSLGGTEREPLSCAFALRDRDNRVLAKGETAVTLADGKTPVTFEAPRVPAGGYFADLWVKKADGIVAFGSIYLEISGDTTLQAVKLEQSYGRNDPVKGTVTIAAKAPVEGLSLSLRQRDSLGRVTARATVPVPPGGGDVAFELPAGAPVAIVQYLEVELGANGETLDRNTVSFSIRDLPAPDDIRFIAWVNGDTSYNGARFLEMLYDAGFDTQYTGFSLWAPHANLRHMPYATRFIDKKTDWYDHPDIPNRTGSDHVRLPCLTDPEYLKAEGEKLAKCAETVGHFSTTEYSMGDECHFVAGKHELCFSPTCVAAFHKFLADDYGTVEAMNKEYGSAFAAFEEVKPVTLAEARENPGLAPLWVDYRRHMESTWAGIYSFATDTIRKIAPDAKIGYEGSDTHVNSFCAADFYKLMNVLRVNGTYDGAFVPYAVMSFAQPGTVLGLGWYGGYNEARCAEYQRYIAWRHLFRGANSYWVWTVNPGSGSTTAPDLTFYDYFRANLEEVNEIQRGVGKLLMQARRADDGIALLYSPPSVHAATLTDGLPQMEEVLNNLVPLLEDSGIQFRVVASAQVEAGELATGKLGVLLLPYAQALSAKETAAIRKFVENGGAVIADLRPGVRDLHGKPLARGALDDVFGVEQMCAAPQPLEEIVKIADAALGADLTKTFADGSLKLSGGKASATVGDAPALVTNKFGKGQAILLNLSLADYSSLQGGSESKITRASEKGTALRTLYRGVLAKVGVEPALAVTPEVAGLRTYRFRAGMTEYIGALQELPELPVSYVLGEAKPLAVTPATIKLKDKAHVYDVRAGRYLGETDEIPVQFEPAKGFLFALLPSAPAGLTVMVSEKIKQGDKLAYEIRLDGVKAGEHVFRVELVSPQGAVFRHYSANLASENLSATAEFQMALNDTPGEWKIRARDVTTGSSTEKTFVIEETP
jgi:beta-galactosidase